MDNWYCPPVKGEVTYDEIQSKADNGEFHEWSFQPMDFQENGYEDVINKLKTYTAVEYIGYEKKRDAAKAAGNEAEAEKWRAEMDRMVDEVYQIYRSKGIYPTLYFSDMGVMQEIERCIAYKAFWDGDTVSCVDGDTEYFNGTLWKCIRRYIEGEKVLQYNEDGSASLVNPIEYIHVTDNNPFYYYHDDILSSALTGNHDVVYRHDSVSCGKITFSELMDSTDTKNYLIPVTCNMKNHKDSLSLKKEEIAEIVNAYSRDVVYASDLIERLGSGIVIFTEKVYQLSYDSRHQLLNKLGFYVRNAVVDCKVPHHAIRLATLFNMTGTVSHCEVAVAYGNEVRVETMRGIGACYDFEKNPVTEVDDVNKYCFVVPSHMLVLRKNGRVFITGNCGAGVGTTLCKYLFPNLQDTPSKHDLDKKGAESIFAKFNNEQYLKRAIKFCYSYKNGCPVPTAIEGGLRLVGSAPSNFRPMNAKAIYERFTPKGGTIYDFCCVSGDTEFFTGNGWKNISDYVEGDKVLQYDKNGAATLVDPLEYIHYTSKAPFYQYKSDILCSCLTGNHDIVYISDYDGSLRKIKQDEIYDKDFDCKIPLTFNYLGGSVYYHKDTIALVLLVYFEGKYTDGYFTVPCCDVSDCNSVISILLNNYIDDIQIKAYSDTAHATYEVTFRWSRYEDFLVFQDGGIKLSDSFANSLYDLGISSKDAFIESTLKYRYKNDNLDYPYLRVHDGVADKFQFLLAASGHTFVRGGSSCGKTNLIQLKANVGYYNNCGYYNIIEDSDKYCFSVPSHMLVLRYMGKIFITGNCGFGGRMLGALSSQNDYKYVGTDPNTETMYHLHQLGEYIEMVTGREDSYELHCCGSEDFKGKPNSIDFAFSSPPYFDLEVYSDEPTQCYNKFPNLEDWLEGYVRQTIKNIIRMLKPGRCYAVNIADFTVGTGGTVAYVDEWIRLSTEEGAPLFDTVYLGVTARAGSKEQAAGELKKENILIFKKPIV